MKNLVYAFLLPVAAILSAAVAQHLFTWVIPGIQRLPTPIVSVDAWGGAIVMGLLCFLAGRWVRRFTGTALAAALSLVGPAALWVFEVAILARDPSPISWFKPITLFVIASASIPTVCVGAGWITGEKQYDLVSRAA